MLRAAQITLAKPTLSRKRLPIKLDLSKYRSPDFTYDTTSGQEVERLLQAVPLNSEGMRWVHQPDGVLFYAIRFVDIPYDEFVERVDISRVGDCFRDVLGINTQVLHRDEAGRPLLQVERIAALAQPNYTAFLGKDELDVYKLEWMEYGADEQRNWMRTVCSPNASTTADDGYLAFSRVPNRPTDPGRVRRPPVLPVPAHHGAHPHGSLDLAPDSPDRGRLPTLLERHVRQHHGPLRGQADRHRQAEPRTAAGARKWHSQPPPVP